MKAPNVNLLPAGQDHIQGHDLEVGTLLYFDVCPTLRGNSEANGKQS